MAKRKTCDRCGRDAAGLAKFCPNCGKAWTAVDAELTMVQQRRAGVKVALVASVLAAVVLGLMLLALS